MGDSPSSADVESGSGSESDCPVCTAASRFVSTVVLVDPGRHDSLYAGLLLGREFAYHGAASRDALLAHPLDFVRQGRPKSGTQFVDSLDDVAVSIAEVARYSL